VGKESQAEFNEAHAPLHADANDQQPVTMIAALKRTKGRGAPIPQPEGYTFWRDYVLPHYGYRLFSTAYPGSTRGEVFHLPWFALDDQSTKLDWWRYRRVVAAAQWKHSNNLHHDVSLLNWPQHDYNLKPLISNAASEDEIAAQAQQLTHAFVYWLQNEATNDVSTIVGGKGFSCLELDGNALGTADGFAQQVYVRESRRIVGLETLTQNEIHYQGGHLTPYQAPNSVTIGWYNMDIHPTVVSGDGVNAKVRPFTLPLGVFIPKDCDNLIPACKNISVTHLVNAATRVHPIEWAIGEVAASIALHSLREGLTPAQIHADTAAVQRLQAELNASGVETQWNAAIQQKMNA
jgi:hypothetical protein